MERLPFLAVSAVILFITAIVGAWLPLYFSKKGKDYSHFYHIGNMLSGGVMLSAGFCHLLADALRHLAFVGPRFPMANFLAALGLLVTMAADQLVHIITERAGGVSVDDGSSATANYGEAVDEERVPLSAAIAAHASHNGPNSKSNGRDAYGVELQMPANGLYAPAGAGAHVRSTSDGQQQQQGLYTLDSAPSSPAAASTTPTNGAAAHGGSGAGDAWAACVGGDKAKLLRLPTSSQGAGGTPGQYEQLAGAPAARRLTHDVGPSASSHQHKVLSVFQGSHTDGGAGFNRYQTLSSGAGGEGGSGHHHRREGSTSHRSTHGGGVGGMMPPDECTSGTRLLMDAGGRSLNFATALLLAAALCVHSILEGMALGAQVSMRSTQDIMLAIAAHKGLAAYALGSSVMESRCSPTRFWFIISAFSLATPVAIFIGYALSTVSNSKGGAALSALAAGTFLYVAMMEVIPRELALPNYRAAKLVALCVGFGLMSLLAVWA